MEKIITYIDQHLFILESIDEICGELYISRAYLHKLFTATLGTSPMKYIKTKRLLAAREMIRIGEKPTNVYFVGDFYIICNGSICCKTDHSR